MHATSLLLSPSSPFLPQNRCHPTKKSHCLHPMARPGSALVNAATGRRSSPSTRRYVTRRMSPYSCRLLSICRGGRAPTRGEERGRRRCCSRRRRRRSRSSSIAVVAGRRHTSRSSSVARSSHIIRSHSRSVPSRGGSHALERRSGVSRSRRSSRRSSSRRRSRLRRRGSEAEGEEEADHSAVRRRRQL